MSLLKYIERLKRMDDLIRRKATGNPEKFSEKLNISRSQLMQDLKEYKELGAPVEYCHFSQSYYYTKPCGVILDFEGRKVYGGFYSFEPLTPFTFLVPYL
jgi:predicted DNA-binding transcriptional regulator YafY